MPGQHFRVQPTPTWGCSNLQTFGNTPRFHRLDPGDGCSGCPAQSGPCPNSPVARCFPNAHALHHHRPADPQIRFHLVHPWHHPWGLWRKCPSHRGWPPGGPPIISASNGTIFRSAIQFLRRRCCSLPPLRMFHCGAVSTSSSVIVSALRQQQDPMGLRSLPRAFSSCCSSVVSSISDLDTANAGRIHASIQ